MSQRKTILLALAATALLAGCGRQGASSLLGTTSAADGARASGLSPAGHEIAPVFDPNNYVATVDNEFFPLPPGAIWVYVEHTPEGVEIDTVEVTHDKKTILGVETTVIRDRVYLEGSLKEDTFDWYAQDKQGNVWYFGEDTKSYDHGQLVGTAGSWEAGQNGAAAGIIMLADPQKGDTYQQENSPGVVADRAKVVRLDASVTVPYGSFDGCLQTADSTPIEPGVREYKFYAKGIGPVLEVTPKGGQGRVELVSFSKPSP